MRHGEAVFIDSGAWTELALSRDPLHAQGREQWELLRQAGRGFIPPPSPSSSKLSHFLIATPFMM
jgi:broad specificity phosphatase PhoE